MKTLPGTYRFRHAMLPVVRILHVKLQLKVIAVSAQAYDELA